MDFKECKWSLNWVSGTKNGCDPYSSSQPPSVCPIALVLVTNRNAPVWLAPQVEGLHDCLQSGFLCKSSLFKICYFGKWKFFHKIYSDHSFPPSSPLRSSPPPSPPNTLSLRNKQEIKTELANQVKQKQKQTKSKNKKQEKQKHSETYKYANIWNPINHKIGQHNTYAKTVRLKKS